MENTEEVDETAASCADLKEMIREVQIEAHKLGLAHDSHLFHNRSVFLPLSTRSKSPARVRELLQISFRSASSTS